MQRIQHIPHNGKGHQENKRTQEYNLEWRRSPQLFRFSPAILHLATYQPGRDVSYPYPPDRYAIARDTRLEPRERLRTLFSRILFNYGVVDRSLGGMVWDLVLPTIKCTRPKTRHSFITTETQTSKVNEVVYVYARIRLSTPNLITTLFISMISTI